MKNLTIFFLGISLLLIGGLACKNNPLAKYTKQYKCTLPNEPEPQTSDEYYKRARKHMELGDSFSFDECAFGAASEAVRLDPQNSDALALRGFLYRAKHDYDAALSDLNEAIRLQPDNPIFLKTRGSVYENQNRIDKAIEDYSAGIKIDASHYDYAKRGSLYVKNNDLENALKDYTEAIKLKPDYENHYTMRAEIYRKLGQQAEAEADEQKAKEFAEKEAGTTDSTTNTRLPVPKTISGGVLNSKATNLVQPPYPAAAKVVRASGAVNVQVTVDEKGDVIAATAVSGHPLLRASAVSAARSLKFSPTLLSGKPVKVTGVIVYNFTP